MPQWTISQVARQAGLRPSAIRYYEQIGVLLPADRSGGQRRYDNTALYRLAVVQRARQIGFTLEEIRQLFFGFRNSASASQRWRKLSQRKLVELESLAGQIKAMQQLLHRLMTHCHCRTLDQCGKGMFEKGCAQVDLKFTPARTRLRSNVDVPAASPTRSR
jgi:MerR family redox-sensitive transcriptional activator SoxR